jgi:hypothetical protein
MMIVGQVSSKEEAKEMELIFKAHVVGNRARNLAEQIKRRRSINGKQKKQKK